VVCALRCEPYGVPRNCIQGQRLGGFGARLKDLSLQDLAQLGYVRQERLGAVDRRANNQQLQRVVLRAHTSMIRKCNGHLNGWNGPCAPKTTAPTLA